MPVTGELWLCNKQKLFHSAASSILLHGIKLSEDQRYLQIYIQHILHLSDTFFLLLIQNVQKKKSDKKKKMDLTSYYPFNISPHSPLLSCSFIFSLCSSLGPPVR